MSELQIRIEKEGKLLAEHFFSLNEGTVVLLSTELRNKALLAELNSETRHS
jgi:hypothetical protein